jgi:hypothetical protein
MLLSVRYRYSEATAAPVGRKLHRNSSNCNPKPVPHVGNENETKGWVPVREKTFAYFATSIIRRCF